jgi:predicted tellurium resistance membrane protein TerC
VNLELFTAPWWSALLAIILIDLVLAGDNAIVIALAARNLPPTCRKKPSSGAPSAPSWSAPP